MRREPSSLRLGPVLLACVLFVAMLPASAVAERTLGLSTGSFEFSVAAGGSGSGDLVVMNDGDEALQVLVYSANQVVDATGTVTYEVPNLTAGDPATNPATWISVRIPTSTQTVGNTPMISLEPGERAPVEFDFTVPANAAPGDHQLLLFFEMLAPTETPEGATAKIAGRLGARIRIRVQGDIVERVEVQPFDVRDFVLGDKMPWVFLARNTGNIDKTIDATLALLDGSDNELWSSDVASETVIYAGTNLERSGVAEGLPALGRFTARLTLTYPLEGAQVDETVVEERTVWVFPLWLAIALVAAVALLLAYASWRRAVRIAERRARLARRQAMAEVRATHDGEDDAIPTEWLEELPHHTVTEPPDDAVHE